MGGVARVVVGYSGGRQADPTYRRIKDHTEALLVEFDPTVISYQKLVEFWTTLHRPINPRVPKQYRSAVWYVTGAQKATAKAVVESWKKRVAKESNRELATSIEAALSFYRAEEYHQSYLDKSTGAYQKRQKELKKKQEKELKKKQQSKMETTELTSSDDDSTEKQHDYQLNKTKHQDRRTSIVVLEKKVPMVNDSNVMDMDEYSV